MKIQEKKVRWIMIVFCLFILFSNVFAQVNKDSKKEISNAVSNSSKNNKIDMSSEERLIRLAYKKLTVYNIVSRYREGEKLKDVLANALKFELSDFKSGSISEIEDTLYEDISTPPNREIIQLIRVNVQETVNEIKREEQIAYEARWTPGMYATMPDRNWTIEDILKLEALKYYDVKRYTSYQVNVSFEGKSRKYRALVLYHGQPENLKLEFLDSIVGMAGNLTHVWQEQQSPFGLNRRFDIQTKQKYSGEDLQGKIKKYLADPKDDSDSTELSISCPENTSDLRQCCINQKLAEFWQANACNGWWTDVNSLIRNVSVNPSTNNFIQFYDSDNQYHIGGGVHHGRARFNAQCIAESTTTQRCDVEIRDDGYGDTENDHSDWYYHVGNVAKAPRALSGPRGQDVSCDSSIGFAFNRCVTLGCGVTLELSVSGSGVGATASVAGGDLWRTAKAEGKICNLPKSTRGGCGSGFTVSGEKFKEGGDSSDICSRCDLDPSDVYMCQQGGGTYDWSSCQCGQSPIVIYVLGNGFNLTNAANGVRFDINGNGSTDQVAWSSTGSDDAWLVLDRNNNGMIDSGKELFGNSTLQPVPPVGEMKNGFLALAVFDKLNNGGNNDGIISQQDLVFASLRLWSDINHNGISESSELKTLAEPGLAKIDLDYRESRRTDENGNRFKYRAKVRDVQGAQIGRWAWDVYLVVQLPQN